MIKILKTDLEGRLILTEEDLNELLEDAFVDGYNSCMINHDLEEEDECECCDKHFASNESYYAGIDDGYTTCLNANIVNKETTERDNNSKPLDDLFESWLKGLLDDLKNESK